jgi:hypothetical protein
MSFSPLQVTFLPLKKIEKETKFENIGVRLTFNAKCFHKKIMAYNLCKCATPDLQEIIIKYHQFFYKDY